MWENLEVTLASNINPQNVSQFLNVLVFGCLHKVTYYLNIFIYNIFAN